MKLTNTVVAGIAVIIIVIMHFGSSYTYMVARYIHIYMPRHLPIHIYIYICGSDHVVLSVEILTKLTVFWWRGPTSDDTLHQCMCFWRVMSRVNLIRAKGVVHMRSLFALAPKEAKAFHEYTQWCDNAAANLRNEINTGSLHCGSLQKEIRTALERKLASEFI